jgi:hypothetical protein
MSSKYLVHVYGSHADGHPIADVAFWDDPRQARGWVAKQREMFPELGHLEVAPCHGVRQIQEIVDLVRSRDEPPDQRRADELEEDEKV